MLDTSVRGILTIGLWGAILFGEPALAAAPPLQEPQAAPAPAENDTIVRPPGDPPRPDSIRFVLPPIEATAARERATAPPVATITVDPEQVRRTQSENPYDLLRRVAGLEVHDQGQGPGFASNVVLRGFTSDHSSDLLLVVDGVPVNLPVHGHVEGYADWSFLFPGAVSSLRVIHGPSSPLHGDFSIAGAVEVYTRSDADGFEGSFSANRFGDASAWGTTGRRGTNGGGLVGVDLRNERGWRDNSRQRLGNVLLRGWRNVGGGRVEGGVALHAAEWDAPGFLSMSDFEDRRLRHATNRSDGGDQARAVAHGRYATSVGDDRFIQVMGWGVVSAWKLYLTTPGHVDATGQLYQTGESDRRWGAGTEVEYSWTPRWGEFTLGTSVRTDRSEYDRDRTLRRRTIEEEVALDAGHAAAGVYLRWRRTFLDRLGLDLGARLDHLRYRSLNRLGTGSSSGAQMVPGDALSPSFHIIGDQGPPGVWVSGSRTVASPKLGARLLLADRWTLMASSSRGFRSAVGVVGDPERPPFLVWANELGLHYERPGLDAHVSFFRSDVTNERIQNPVTLSISSAGGSVRQGIEGKLEVDAPGGVTLFGRATYTHASLDGRYADAHHDHGHETSIVPMAWTDVAPVAGPSNQVVPDEEDEPGQRVPGIASYIGQISATIPIRSYLEGRIEWRVAGPYVPIGEADMKTDPFSVTDVGVRFPVHRFLVDLEVRNVLNAVYPETRSSGYVSPGTPRNVAISIQYLERR